jgi:hypothetical protein
MTDSGLEQSAIPRSQDAPLGMIPVRRENTIGVRPMVAAALLLVGVIVTLFCAFSASVLLGFGVVGTMSIGLGVILAYEDD